MIYLYNFLLGVAVNVAGYYVCKWLDAQSKGK